MDIKTPYEKIQKMAHMEVPIKEILNIKENYVINEAQKAQCSANCLVPCGILNLCWLEAGFIAKSLAENADKLTISFDEIN